MESTFRNSLFQEEHKFYRTGPPDAEFVLRTPNVSIGSLVTADTDHSATATQTIRHPKIPPLRRDARWEEKTNAIAPMPTSQTNLNSSSTSNDSSMLNLLSSAAELLDDSMDTDMLPPMKARRVSQEVHHAVELISSLRYATPKSVRSRSMENLAQMSLTQQQLPPMQPQSSELQPQLQNYFHHSFPQQLGFLATKRGRGHTPRPLQCKSCDMRFSTSSEMNAHRLQFHRELMCSKCGKTFSRQDSLKRHLMNASTDPASGRCVNRLANHVSLSPARSFTKTAESSEPVSEGTPQHP